MVPTEDEVRQFVTRYCDFVILVNQRRRTIRAANEAAGAPRRSNKKREVDSFNVHKCGAVNPEHLLQVALFLSPTNDEHPPIDDDMQLTNQDKVLLLIALIRCKGWRTRSVSQFNLVGLDLNVDHPLFVMTKIGNVFRKLSAQSNNMPTVSSGLDSKPAAKANDQDDDNNELGWVEILCHPSSSTTKSCKSFESKPKRHYRWIHVDPSLNLMNQSNAVGAIFKSLIHAEKGGRKAASIPYVLAVEHISNDDGNLCQVRLTDVTPRYANSWSQTLLLRSVKRSRTNAVTDNAWWIETLRQVICFGHTHGNEKCAPKSGNSKLDAIEIQDSDDDNSGSE